MSHPQPFMVSRFGVPGEPSRTTSPGPPKTCPEPAEGTCPEPADRGFSSPLLVPSHSSTLCPLPFPTGHISPKSGHIGTKSGHIHAKSGHIGGKRWTPVNLPLTPAAHMEVPADPLQDAQPGAASVRPEPVE